jgi:hypothetical protein
MKRVVLVGMVLLPLALAAQEQAPSPTKSPGAVASSAQASTSSISDYASSDEPDTRTDVVSSPDANASQQPSAKPRQSRKPRGEPKPKIPGSMVGYIDDAIIASQVRIRFDAAFHDNAPDRAEFFYAQYNGLNGPGPRSVVADLNFQQLYLHGEYALKKRLSFFAEVPVRWIQPQRTVANVANQGPPFANVNSAGLSDLAAGFKLAALASSNQYLTFQFQAYFPSGNASTGLGTHHYSIEPALLYYRRLSDRVALEAQVGDSHPIGGSFCPQPCITTSSEAPPPASGGFAGDVFFYGVGPSYVLYRGDHVQIAPVIELVGWRVLGGLQTNCVPSVLDCLNQEGASADGTNIVNLKVGARTMVGAHNSLYIGYGHQLAHAVWYKEIVRIEYRYAF